MTTARIFAQVQAGIDARIDQPIVDAAAKLTAGTRTVLGYDGTTVDDAITAATRPGGLPPADLRARIEFRRANPHRFHPDTHAA